MNITEGVEFKIKMYKNTDISKYESELNKNSEFADDLGIELNEYPELPKYYLGRIKLDPTNIVCYSESYSPEASIAKEDLKFDCVTIKYKIADSTYDEFTVTHTYEEVEKIIKNWFKKREKDERHSSTS